jgi:hypothetical protein
MRRCGDRPWTASVHMLCYAALRYARLCYATLGYAMLCYAKLWSMLSTSTPCATAVASSSGGHPECRL